MEINVDLNAEQINQEIQRAVAESVIGEQLKKIIKQSIEELSSSWKNPIKPVVDQIIIDSIKELVREEYFEQIKNFVKEKMTQEFMDSIIQKLWDNWVKEK